MNPTPEQTEATLRWLFDQPLAQVLVISQVILNTVLLIALIMQIRANSKRDTGSTQEQTAALRIAGNLVNVVAKLTDHVEAIANKVAMTGEQVTALSLITASVNDSFGRFRIGMSKWIKADYTTKRLLQREMQEIRTQCQLLNSAVNRVDAALSDRKPVILGKEQHR